MPTDPIRRLAEHVVSTRWDDVPAPAVEAAKVSMLDALGVGVAGSGDPWAARLAQAAAGWGSGAEASVWGTGLGLPAAGAALVNAYQLHCLEFDPLHEDAVVHALTALLPALAAQVERRGGAAGRDVLAAVVLGVDVACALGLASRSPMRFFRPATAGGFAAVAALGRLEGLDADALVSAFGILYGQVCGTLQPHAEGSPVLAMQLGFNARAALTSLDLARAGIPGPRAVLEGPYGYFPLFEGAWDAAPALDGLGRAWHVTRLAHKPFPSGRLTHGAADGLLRLRAEHGFAAGDVERVTVAVPPLVRRLVGRPDVPAPAPSYARLCLPFVAATALRRGGVDVPDFAPERLADPATHALAARVRVEDDGNADENAMVPQTVEVLLRGGRRHALRVETVLGHPDRPLSRAQHLDKLRRNGRHGARPLAPERVEQLAERVDRLETVGDVREALALLVP
jgi:2-methylcitrate dehydratase PrpD